MAFFEGCPGAAGLVDGVVDQGPDFRGRGQGRVGLAGQGLGGGVQGLRFRGG